MKSKSNLSHEETASLESQLDTMRKQSQESKQLVERQRKFKAEKQHVHDTGVNLVCVVRICIYHLIIIATYDTNQLQFKYNMRL